MTKKMRFKDRAAYKRWLAYDAIHNPKFGEHPVDVDIQGKHAHGPVVEGMSRESFVDQLRSAGVMHDGNRRKQRPGYTWVEGHSTSAFGGRGWVSGHWRRLRRRA